MHPKYIFSPIQSNGGVEMTRFRNIANDASYPPFFRTYLALREITQNQ